MYVEYVNDNTAEYYYGFIAFRKVVSTIVTSSITMFKFKFIFFLRGDKINFYLRKKRFLIILSYIVVPVLHSKVCTALF